MARGIWELHTCLAWCWLPVLPICTNYPVRAAPPLSCRRVATCSKGLALWELCRFPFCCCDKALWAKASEQRKGLVWAHRSQSLIAGSQGGTWSRSHGGIELAASLADWLVVSVLRQLPPTCQGMVLPTVGYINLPHLRPIRSGHSPNWVSSLGDPRLCQVDS